MCYYYHYFYFFCYCYWNYSGYTLQDILALYERSLVYSLFACFFSVRAAYISQNCIGDTCRFKYDSEFWRKPVQLTIQIWRRTAHRFQVIQRILDAFKSVVICKEQDLQRLVILGIGLEDYSKWFDSGIEMEGEEKSTTLGENQS